MSLGSQALGTRDRWGRRQLLAAAAASAVGSLRKNRHPRTQRARGCADSSRMRHGNLESRRSPCRPPGGRPIESHTGSHSVIQGQLSLEDKSVHSRVTGCSEPGAEL